MKEYVIGIFIGFVMCSFFILSILADNVAETKTNTVVIKKQAAAIVSIKKDLNKVLNKRTSPMYQQEEK